MIRQQQVEDHPVKTDRNGVFTFDGTGHVRYEINLIASETPPVFRGIGTIAVAGGHAVEMGNIVLQFSSKHEPMIHVLGPVQMTGLPSKMNSMAVPSTANPDTGIVAVYTLCSSSSAEFCAHPALHIVLTNGTEIQPTSEKEQVGSSSAMISLDNGAVGWLVDSDFCCTSYPIQLTLVVYRPGKTLQRFTGDGRAIFQWQFIGGGKQVAFYQDFLHGTPGQHYELRDVDTGRLVASWDGEITAKAPGWVQGLR
jgi:hypothetical protein